jgi:zinc transport system ATP-binding protein
VNTNVEARTRERGSGREDIGAAPPAIEMRDVSFSYDRHTVLSNAGHPVLANVNIRIEERDFVTVVGPNGGGKTTLLKLILGILQPSCGSVGVLGTRPENARPRIGYTPQHSAIDPGFPARVIDVVLMGRLGRRRSWHGYTRADREAAMEALREVELADRYTRPFATLSAGQRQRVLIARALAPDPELLLLDEPTSSLDVAMEEELHGLLTRLHGRLTIVVVSHDIGFVSELTETVLCVKQTVAAHSTSEITPELIREMYGRDVLMVRHDHNDHCSEEGR